jgi:RNA-directed DNA polymerase
VDGVTVAQFQARLFANLKALQNNLRRRRYSPQLVKRLSIPKPDGTKRPLGILTVRDRIAQRAVLT